MSIVAQTIRTVCKRDNFKKYFQNCEFSHFIHILIESVAWHSEDKLG